VRDRERERERERERRKGWGSTTFVSLNACTYISRDDSARAKHTWNSRSGLRDARVPYIMEVNLVYTPSRISIHANTLAYDRDQSAARSAGRISSAEGNAEAARSKRAASVISALVRSCPWAIELHSINARQAQWCGACPIFYYFYFILLFL
jgi:hypothetical protein